MAYTQIYTDKGAYLLCITDGMVDNAESFIEWGLSVMGRAREMGHTRVLFDNRTFRLYLTPLDVITFASHLEKIGAARMGFRMAVLSNPANLETSRLVETALVNRSGSYKGFRSQKEAKEWLLN